MTNLAASLSKESNDMPNQHTVYWPAKDLEILRKLWMTDMTTAKIGEAMGRSKNSIVGKAHRLNLPGRGSPIKSNGHPPKPRILRVPPNVATLPPLKSAVVIVRELPPMVVGNLPDSYGCQYPIGELREPNFRFCDAPRQRGRSYCDEHHDLCWKMPPALRDMAA